LELAHVEARTVEATADSALWFGVRNQGVARFRSDELRWFTEADGLHSVGVADLTVTKAGTLWAAGQGGVSRFDGQQWIGQNRLGSVQPRVVFNIHEEAASGALWMATDQGAVRLDNSLWAVTRASDGLPHNVVHGVVTLPDGTAWFACRTGVARMTEGEIQTFFAGTNFRTAIPDGRGGAWFGTSDGAYHWDGTDWTTGLEGHTIYPKIVAMDGTVWAGSAGAGLFRWVAGQWRAVTLPDRLHGAEIFDVAEAPDGAIWLATSHGVARLVPEGNPRTRFQAMPGPA